MNDKLRHFLNEKIQGKTDLPKFYTEEIYKKMKKDINWKQIGKEVEDILMMEFSVEQNLAGRISSNFVSYLKYDEGIGIKSAIKKSLKQSIKPY